MSLLLCLIPLRNAQPDKGLQVRATRLQKAQAPLCADLFLEFWLNVHPQLYILWAFSMFSFVNEFQSRLLSFGLQALQSCPMDKG